MPWELTGNTGNPRSAFLGTTDNNAVVVKTNGAERLRVDENGNVGIGTGNPNRSLSVNGTIETIYEGIYFGGMFGVGGADYYYGIGARFSNSLVYDSFQYHRWRVGTNEKMTLDDAGRLKVTATDTNTAVSGYSPNGYGVGGTSDFSLALPDTPPRPAGLQCRV